MAVLVPERDEEYAEIAEEIADDRDEEIIGDLSEAGDGTIICVVPPMEFTEALGLSLQRRLDENGPDKGAYGIITGMTAEEARKLYYREPTDQPNHCIIVRQEDKERFSYDEDTEVYTRHTATADNVNRLNDEGLESMSMMIDARSIHGYLSDGYICGVPTDRDVESFGGSQPPCIDADGERDCPYDGELIPANELYTEHAFLNSCMSMLPTNDENGLPVHVGMNLLQNSVSVIGGFRPVDGLLHQTVLHYALLRAGYSAIERCDTLVNQSHALNVEQYPFLLFGTPEVTIENSTPTEYDVELTEKDDSFVIDVDEPSTHVIDVSIPADKFDAGNGPFVKNLTDEHADAPLYYVAIPDDDEIRVLVYSWGLIDVDSLRFEVVPENEQQIEYERLRSSLRNARKLEELAMGDRKYKGQIENFRNHLLGFAPYLDEQRYKANAYRDTEEHLQQARKNANQVRGYIRELLEDRGPSFLSNEYSERSIARDVHVDPDPCYACGRPVYVKEFASASGDVRRLRGICPRCVNTYDVPKVEGEDENLHPRIEGDLWFEPGTTTTVDLRFQNPLDEPMEAMYFFWLCSPEGDIRGEPIFEPDQKKVTLAPHEERALEFEVSPPSRLPEDDYTLYGYVIGNMQIYAGMQTAQIHQAGTNW